MMKAQVERLKKRLSLVEKGRDLTAIENQIKSVQVELEALRQTKRGLESIFNN